MKRVLAYTAAALVVVLVGIGVARAAMVPCPIGPDDECRGTKTADRITGTLGVDEIYALGGDDSVKGGYGEDTMYGGDGDDRAGGAAGNDIFYGGAGNDRMSGGEGQDEIHGGPGDDIDLDGDDLIDKIYGEEGDDFELDGDRGNDLLYGGPGDDGGAPNSDNLTNHGLRGEGGENQVYGEGGDDTMDAQRAVDVGELRSRSSAAKGTTPSLRLTKCKTRSTAARVWTRSSLTIGDSTSW